MYCVLRRFGGAAGKKNKKRRTSAPARKNNKKVRTYLLFFSFFLVRFWAFLGKGSSKTREKKLSLKKNHRGNIFSGGRNFFWVICFNSFSFDFFVALDKRLSVKGTQKRDKKSFTGSCV
jgi:hypothetical protein